MYNVAFGGRKLYNNYTILGDAMQEKTPVNDDINFLKSIPNYIEKTDIPTERGQLNTDVFKKGNLRFSFGNGLNLGDYRKIFIKDCSENITRVFNKDEFANHEYSKAFKNCMESVRKVLTTF